MSIPALELVRHTFFDTKELPPDDSRTTGLEFFRQPNSDQRLSNWPAQGTLPHPQQFYMFGLLLNVYSANSPMSSSEDLQCLHRTLVNDCNISYIVGNTCHLNIPVLSTIKGHIPEACKPLFQTSETIEKLALCEVVQSKLRRIPGRIANPEPRDFFYNTCIFRDNEWIPCHISSIQFFMAVLTWIRGESLAYDAGLFGKIHFRVSMLGVLCRETV